MTIKDFIRNGWKDTKFRVKCTDNADEEAILVFDTEEEADAFIERELTQCKICCRDQRYDYADCGNTTKFWLCDEINWVEWARLWK